MENPRDEAEDAETRRRRHFAEKQRQFLSPDCGIRGDAAGRIRAAADGADDQFIDAQFPARVCASRASADAIHMHMLADGKMRLTFSPLRFNGYRVNLTRTFRISIYSRRALTVAFFIGATVCAFVAWEIAGRSGGKGITEFVAPFLRSHPGVGKAWSLIEFADSPLLFVVSAFGFGGVMSCVFLLCSPLFFQFRVPTPTDAAETERYDY